jgi:hypothetical protein
MGPVPNQVLNVFDQARQFALDTKKSPTIILKQTEHFGDTLYATPVLRHYRLKYPQAAIIYVAGDKYAEIHRYNPYIDKFYSVPTVSDWRKAYVEKLFSLSGIDFKLAPAVIFHTWLPSHKWTLPNIFDQYAHNAGIVDLNLLGGRKPVAVTDKDDEDWVTSFLQRTGVDPNRAIALECYSYSHPRPYGWPPADFQKFCDLCVGKIYVISLAGQQERIYTRTVDGRGMSWRRSAALLNRVRGIVGVSSGMSVLASTCPSNPFIYELNCPDSVSIRKMGFSENCESLIGKTPEAVLALCLSKMG